MNEKMTFEELCELHRAEMRCKGIIDCRKDLYKAMAVLILDLTEDYHTQLQKDPDSIMTEGASLRRKNAIQIRKVITELRTKKVGSKAIACGQGYTNDTWNYMTPEEQTFFTLIRQATESHTDGIRNGV